MAQWWTSLKDGEPRVFGFLQIDIVGSSSLPGTNAALMRTKGTLRTQLHGIAAIYDVMPLAWAGDGGSFALLIDQEESYDVLVQCALHLLETVAFVNQMKGTPNMTHTQIGVRISGHAAQAVFNREGSLFHGDELNPFLKNEREIGVPNSVVITEAVHGQLLSDVLRDSFGALDKVWKFRSGGEERTQKLHISPKPSEKVKEQPKPNTPPSISPKEMVDLTAKAFAALGAKVQINVIIGGMEADIILEQVVPGAGTLRTVVECKAFKTPLGVQEVREVAFRATHLQRHGIDRGILVSLAGFSRSAKVEAQSTRLALLTLEELIVQAGGKNALPELPPPDRSHRERHRAAFVLMPFRKDLDDVYFYGIRQPFERAGFVVARADEMQFTGGVLDHIFKAIKEADVVIADMTDANPNVYYEVGFAHAMNKKVVLVTSSIESLPFDLRGMRHIAYETARELSEKLAMVIENMGAEAQQAPAH